MIICITGKYGSGKTTTAKLLGLKTISADKTGKKVFSIKQKEIKQLLKTTDKKKIRQKIFSNKKSLKKFNAIMHPEMIKLIKKEIRKNKRKNIIIDAALYHDLKLDRLCDKTVLIKRDKKKIIKSLNMRGKDVEAILKNQRVPSKADFVIINNFSKKRLRKETAKLRKKLEQD